MGIGQHHLPFYHLLHDRDDNTVHVIDHVKERTYDQYPMRPPPPGLEIVRGGGGGRFGIAHRIGGDITMNTHEGQYIWPLTLLSASLDSV